MNHQRFKFYHHSTEYYRQLYNSIKQLEDNCKDINYTVLPSTINYKRKSKFIKVIVIQINYIKRLGESHDSHSSQSVSCDLLYSLYLSEIPHISWQSQDKML